MDVEDNNIIKSGIGSNVLRVPEVGDQREPIWAEQSVAGYSLLGTVSATKTFSESTRMYFLSRIKMQLLSSVSLTSIRRLQMLIMHQAQFPLQTLMQ